MFRKYLPVVILSVLIVSGLVLYKFTLPHSLLAPHDYSMENPFASLSSEKTTIATIGELTFVDSNSRPELVYNQNTDSKSLYFDDMSYCTIDNNSSPCVGLLDTLPDREQPMRVLVDGYDGDSILVRRLEVVTEERFVDIPDAGNMYISWPQAVSLIQSCQVALIRGSSNEPSLVTLSSNGHTVTTIQPTYSDSRELYESSKNSCKNLKFTS